MSDSPPTSSSSPRPQDHVRVRVSKACQRCRGFKLKCSAEEPCKRCKHANAECIYLASKPRAKPKYIKPKFTNLKEKEAKLEATFDKVTQLVKKLSNTDISGYDLEDDQDIIKNYIQFSLLNIKDSESFYRVPKLVHQLPETLYMSPPGDAELSLITSYQNPENSEFCNHLLHSFIAKLLYSFPLIVPIDMNSLFQMSIKESPLLNAVLAIALRIFYFEQGIDVHSANPFYFYAKYILSNENQEPTIELAQAHALVGLVEMSRGWVLQSVNSTNKATRIAQILGVDQICYNCADEFDPEHLEACLLWINCLTFDCLHSAELDLPPIIHKSTIRLSPDEMPSFDLYQRFTEEKNFRMFIQSKLFYCVANFVNHVKILSRQFQSKSKTTEGMERLADELDHLYAKAQEFQTSGWILPIDFQIEETNIEDKQELFTIIVRSLMFRISYVKICQMKQQLYYICPSSKSRHLTPDITLNILFELQSTCQNIAMNTIQLYSKLKNSDHPDLNQTYRQVCSITPTLAFTFGVLTQHFLHDLSPFGKSCYDLCLQEATYLSMLWPVLKPWISQLQKARQRTQIPDMYHFAPSEF